MMNSEQHPCFIKRQESGAALLIAMLMLVMMGMIGLASLKAVNFDQQISGFQNQARAALYAGEAGLANARNILFTTDLPEGVANLVSFHPVLPATNLGDAALYPYGLPSFSADSAVVNPIDWIGSGGTCDDWVMSIEMSGSASNALWRESLWDMRVAGQTASGALSRLQATGTRCYPFN